MPLESAENLVLGLLPRAEYELFTVSLEPGDAVFMYTDGVTEAMNGDGEEFGEVRLVEALSGGPVESAAGCCALVVDAVREFAGGEPQSDDITCLAVRRDQ